MSDSIDTTNYKFAAQVSIAALIFIAGVGVGAFMHMIGAADTGMQERGMQYEAVRLGYGHWIDRGGFWSGGYEFSWNIPAQVKPHIEATKP